MAVQAIALAARASEQFVTTPNATPSPRSAPSTSRGTVRLAASTGPWQAVSMTISPNPYRGFCFPPAVIEHAVWLYHCFSLSLRDVELILAARGIVVSYESIREWGLRCGRSFANALKRRRPQPDATSDM